MIAHLLRALRSFTGVCFDIEETEGEQELIDAFEKTFATLQKEGLQAWLLCRKLVRCTPCY